MYVVWGGAVFTVKREKLVFGYVKTWHRWSDALDKKKQVVMMMSVESNAVMSNH